MKRIFILFFMCLFLFGMFSPGVIHLPNPGKKLPISLAQILPNPPQKPKQPKLPDPGGPLPPDYLF